MILKSVYSVFEDSILTSESLLASFVALNRPIFDPEAITARRRLLRHASKFLDTLVRWRKYTGEAFGIGELCVRHMNNVALPIAESGWDVGGEEIAREVIDQNISDDCVTNYSAQMISVLPRELIRALKAPLSALAT
jgi:GC-rich sequence DNA-binding factor